MIKARDILEQITDLKNSTNKIEPTIEKEVEKETVNPEYEVSNFIRQEQGTVRARAGWIEASDEYLKEIFDDLQVRFILFMKTVAKDTMTRTKESFVIHLRAAGDTWPDTLARDYFLNEPASLTSEEAISKFDELSQIAEKEGSIGLNFPNSRSKNLKPYWLEISRIIAHHGV